VIKPTDDEVAQVLAIFEMLPTDVRCVYCGNPSSEWDHLRPLVVRLRPTGYISEIANLVPACGKCNQSKGNKPWREWMLRTTGRHSPSARGITDVAERMKRLEAFEAWHEPTKLDFEAIAGSDPWSEYWAMWSALNVDLQRCQTAANVIRDQARKSLVTNH